MSGCLGSELRHKDFREFLPFTISPFGPESFDPEPLGLELVAERLMTEGLTTVGLVADSLGREGFYGGIGQGVDDPR